MNRLMFSINPPSTSLELTLLDSAYLERYFFAYLFSVREHECMCACIENPEDNLCSCSSRATHLLACTCLNDMLAGQ